MERLLLESGDALLKEDGGNIILEAVVYGPHDRGVLSIWTSGRRLPVMKYYKAATLLLLMRWW